jgi:transposase
VDVEPRQPVALLPDRTAEPVAQWLQAHPGVEGIARDRSRAYAEGARQGASAAIQVADRFHGLHHLREALDHVFTTSPQACDAVNTLNTLERQPPVLLPDGVVAVPVPPPAEPPTPAQQRAVQRQAHRQALHTQIWTVPQQGGTGAAMAQHVGLRLRTVQRDLRPATCAGRKRRSAVGARLRTPYKAYLRERWHAGGSTAMRLLRESRQRGDGGGAGGGAA